MMISKNQLVAACAVIALSPVASAQLISTDGANPGDDTTYDYLSAATSCTSTAGLTDFTATGMDTTFQHWWYYCINGASCAFNDGAANGSYNLAAPEASCGTNVGQTSWSNVDGNNFDATWNVAVQDLGLNSGAYISTMKVTNAGTAPLTIDLYGYVDIDLCASAGGDSATSPAAGTIVVTDLACPNESLEIQSIGSVGDEVGAWPSVRNNVIGACPQYSGSSWSGSGQTFGPADFSAASQWSATLNPGQSVTCKMVVTHNGAHTPAGSSASSSAFGSSGTNGPSLVSKCDPILGSIGVLGIGGGQANANCVINFGTMQTNIPVSNVVAYTLPDLSNAAVVLDGNGASCRCLPIPYVNSLAGASVFLQVVCLDPTQSPIPANYSNGLRWTLGD